MTPEGDASPGAGPGALAFRPDAAEFAALAKEHAIVPVWCEVVADTLTPVACFANVVGDGEGFLFESVEGGERWGRYSFVGRRPLATLTARGGRSRRPGGWTSRSPTTGSWPRSRAWWRVSNRRCCPASRPCTAAWSGISATTWCARWSGCQTRRTTTWAIPMPRWWSSGSSAPSTTGASASCSSTTSWCPTPRTVWSTPRRWPGPSTPPAGACGNWRRTADGPGRCRASWCPRPRPVWSGPRRRGR